MYLLVDLPPPPLAEEGDCSELNTNGDLLLLLLLLGHNPSSPFEQATMVSAPPRQGL
jgi:hypothetical protein